MSKFGYTGIYLTYDYQGHDGLVLEFRGSKSKWTLMAPSVDNLKVLTAALWEVMDMDGRFMNFSPLQKDILDFG